MILLMEMVFAILVLLIVSGIIVTVNRDIQARLQVRDLMKYYTPNQIKELSKNGLGKKDD